ncbi:putative trafficking protein particle complex subunit [Rosa chinensis]|uniref:Trafficking protein particle complex subunit n=1 Tax=Rosa chinensis TaxID=74649 RepID=A0A2P6R234_ROSCH|nr:putative trafficking protein particle complex subunit [Rosa chinensis]
MTNILSVYLLLQVYNATTTIFCTKTWCIFSEPGRQHMEGLLKHIYELYTDYVLKNPFYEIEMPTQCELFDMNLTQAIQKDCVALLAR